MDELRKRPQSQSPDEEHKLNLEATDAYSPTTGHPKIKAVVPPTRELVSAALWIPLSLCVALFFAVNNEIKSYIANYHFYAMLMQAPASFLSAIVMSCILSFKHKFSKKKEEPTIGLTMGDDPVQTERESYITWFYDIFYVKECTEHSEGARVAPVNYKLSWRRIYATIAICALEIVAIFCQFQSYYFAKLAHFNTGVLTSLFAVKIILITGVFAVLFHQRLKFYDYVGIFFCIMCVSAITLSKSRGGANFDPEKYGSFLLSLTLIITAILILIPRDIITKFNFAFKDQNVNIIAFRTFHDIAFYSVLTVGLAIAMLFGFRCTWKDFFYASIGGVVHLGGSLLHNYVIMRSLAAAAEAIIYSSNTFQILLDAFLFHRNPNVLQITGMLFAFMSVIFIIISNKSGH